MLEMKWNESDIPALQKKGHLVSYVANNVLACLVVICPDSSDLIIGFKLPFFAKTLKSQWMC